MKVLYHIIVHVLLLATAPYVLGRCIFDGRFRRDILARLSAIKRTPKNHGGIWIHASSAGEVRAAVLLWRTMVEIGFSPVLSTFTETGYKLAKKENLKPIFRLPPDSTIWMGHLLEKLKPSLLVLVEAELWPALLWQCKERNIPTILINGRMSLKSFTRYSKLNRFFRSIEKAVTAFSMRSEQDGERIRMLGTSPNKVHVTGNIKFDAIPSETVNLKKMEQNDVPIIVFGSTRPGDEVPVLNAMKKLFDEFPDLQCVLAPRHVQRIKEIQELIKDLELDYVKHSEIFTGNNFTESFPSKAIKQYDGKPKILLVDTVGYLNDYYIKSDIAFVGGGFNPRFGGHNILEAAVCKQPVIYGKYMENFEEEVRLLNQSGGGIQLDSPEQLYSTLRQLLRDPKKRLKLGQAAFKTVLLNQGAVQKNMKLIESLLL